MTDDQFDILIEKLDEISRNLSSDLTTINMTLETIQSRVGSIRDNDSTFKLLTDVKSEIEHIANKLE